MIPWLLAAAMFASNLRDAQVGDPVAPAVEVSGTISVLADALPRRDVSELRPRASVDVAARLSPAVRVKFDGFTEALVADRDGKVTSAAVRVREAWIEAAGAKGDLRAGYGRIIWGRLDEVQPSDVINPLNTARFLFDGRGDARLPVTFVRGRIFAAEGLVVEGVLVPRFRDGTFDELDEASSPFNLIRDLVLPASTVASTPDVDRISPRGWDAVSGGGRVSATLGRVDVAAAVFRGREGFGVVAFEPELPLGPPGAAPAIVGRLVERFPRFTMISADAETVVGEWAVRGEVAVFTEKTLAGPGGPVSGRAWDAGVGVDRRTGGFRIFGSLIARREWSVDDPNAPARTDVTLVGSIERQFLRDTWLARLFAVVNPGDASGFVRGLVVWRLRDNVSVDGSAAAFLGDGDDALGRFKTRDFILSRLTYHW